MWAVLFALVTLFALPAAAGPWPREKGEGFVSLSTSGGAIGLWAEYGLGRGKWLVLDAMRGGDGHLRAQIGWHRATGKTDARHRFAFGFALGAELTPLGEAIPYASTNASWGMGVQRPFNGWLSFDLDSRAGMSVQTLVLYQVTKANLTLGATFGDRLKGIVQLQARHQDPVFEMHLAPSIVYEWRKGMHVELGLRQDLMGQGGQEVKLGSWFRF
jgi:hypothetical protein